MSLIDITAPGDWVGMVKSFFDMVNQLAQTVEALASDNSPAGQAIKAEAAALLTPIAAITQKIDNLLNIHVQALTSQSSNTPPTS